MNWLRTSNMLGQALGILERTQLMVDVNGADSKAAAHVSSCLEQMIGQLMDLTLKCTPVTSHVADGVFQDIPPSIVSSFKQNGILV